MKILKIQRLDPAARVPVRAYEHDAGLDLYSLERHTLAPGEGRIFKTGIALEIDPGFVGLVWDRSSMGKRGIKTLGGVIDSGYRGEVGVILWNLSKEPQEIQSGDKIAQLLIQPISTPVSREVEILSSSERGTGGFGSSGK
ncbi:MAG: dUTP diphosphatase [Proteobacteria bacterium]|nr:dUTP diphosphatase [Pseudomonadota bacterium]